MVKTPKLIGICGPIGAGKDTIAGTLVGIGWMRYSMANPLKDLTARLFDWPRDMVEGSTDASRKWREQPDAWWSERLGREVTPRWALQYLGTEVMRQNFHNEIWVACMERFVTQNNFDVVISDVRFPNEIEAVRRLGGEIWQVHRNPLPYWWDEAKAKGKVDGVHESETAWIPYEPDRVFSNTGSLQDLRLAVLDAVRS